MAWLALHIGCNTEPSCYIGKIGIYTVRVKRLQQTVSGKYHWMFHIHNNGDNCNAISDMAFTDDEVKKYVEDLVAGLQGGKQ